MDALLFDIILSARNSRHPLFGSLTIGAGYRRQGKVSNTRFRIFSASLEKSSKSQYTVRVGEGLGHVTFCGLMFELGFPVISSLFVASTLLF